MYISQPNVIDRSGTDGVIGRLIVVQRFEFTHYPEVVEGRVHP